MVKQHRTGRRYWVSRSFKRGEQIHRLLLHLVGGLIRRKKEIVQEMKRAENAMLINARRRRYDRITQPENCIVGVA